MEIWYTGWILYISLIYYQFLNIKISYYQSMVLILSYAIANFTENDVVIYL